MSSIKCKVKQLRGELGLRVPGTILSIPKKQAEKWIQLGYVERVEKPKPKKKDK